MQGPRDGVGLFAPAEGGPGLVPVRFIQPAAGDFVGECFDLPFEGAAQAGGDGEGQAEQRPPDEGGVALHRPIEGGGLDAQQDDTALGIHHLQPVRAAIAQGPAVEALEGVGQAGHLGEIEVAGGCGTGGECQGE